GRESPGLGGTGTGSEGFPGRGPLGRSVPSGPLRGSPLILESLGDPSLGAPLIGANLSEELVVRMSRNLFAQARAIANPIDRSEALERAARVQIRGARDLRFRDDFAKLGEARQALLEAFDALRQVRDVRGAEARFRIPIDASAPSSRTAYPNTVHDIRSQALI